MASLLETIRGNLSQQAAAPKAGMQDEGEKVRKLLAAKSGNVAGMRQGVAQSNLGEAAAVDQTRLGQEQLAQQGQIQAQEIGQTEQKLQQQDSQARQQINLQQRANTLQNTIQTEELLNGLERDRAGLDMEKDRARLEQTAQNLAFQDKKYIDQLQRAGEVGRLNDSLSFQRELTKSIFKENTDLLSQDIANQAAMAKDRRAYDKVLMGTRLADMLARGKMDDAAAANVGKYQALGTIGGGLIGMAAKKYAPEEKTTTAAPMAGAKP